MRKKGMTPAQRAKREAKRARRAAQRQAEQAAFEARWSGALHEWCGRVIEFREGQPFCATCDRFVDEDNLEKWCEARNVGAEGQLQRCGNSYGHDGADEGWHTWMCDAERVGPDGVAERCLLEADDDHSEGHSWEAVAPPRCLELAPTKFDLPVRCNLGARHDEEHHAYGRFGMNDVLYVYDHRWSGTPAPPATLTVHSLDEGPPASFEDFAYMFIPGLIGVPRAFKGWCPKCKGEGVYVEGTLGGVPPELRDKAPPEMAVGFRRRCGTCGHEDWSMSSQPEFGEELGDGL